MKRFVIGFGWLVAACVTVAGTGTSNEFRVGGLLHGRADGSGDPRLLHVWEMRSVARFDGGSRQGGMIIRIFDIIRTNGNG